MVCPGNEEIVNDANALKSYLQGFSYWYKKKLSTEQFRRYRNEPLGQCKISDPALKPSPSKYTMVVFKQL